MLALGVVVSSTLGWASVGAGSSWVDSSFQVVALSGVVPDQSTTSTGAEDGPLGRPIESKKRARSPVGADAGRYDVPTVVTVAEQNSGLQACRRYRYVPLPGIWWVKVVASAPSTSVIVAGPSPLTCSPCKRYSVSTLLRSSHRSTTLRPSEPPAWRKLPGGAGVMVVTKRCSSGGRIARA